MRDYYNFGMHTAALRCLGKLCLKSRRFLPGRVIIALGLIAFVLSFSTFPLLYSVAAISFRASSPFIKPYTSAKAPACD